jgi:LmbE family N-acetylglucosaminyl deacetylase
MQPVATLVFFHAHPDDEAIATGGVMAKAAAAGHRVVLITATRGEHGEVDDGFLESGEQLWERRVKETAEAARILGVHRQDFLGYVDSGMMGTPTNDASESFWQADVDEAAKRLAAILEEETADILTVYDEHGAYGHPDHIQVHRVGVRAAEMAGTKEVFESTINRDHIRRMIELATAAGQVPEGAPTAEDLDAASTTEGEIDPQDPGFGMPESAITTFVDVRDVVDLKRKAMAAHASQISETSFFLAMPEDAFREAFGEEWFIHHGVPAGTRETAII